MVLENWIIYDQRMDLVERIQLLQHHKLMFKFQLSELFIE